MSDAQELWLVGRITGRSWWWEVQGLYAAESDAAARCEDTTWFVMPLRVGEYVGTDTQPNARAYYPLARVPS